MPGKINFAWGVNIRIRLFGIGILMKYKYGSVKFSSRPPASFAGCLNHPHWENRNLGAVENLPGKNVSNIILIIHNLLHNADLNAAVFNTNGICGYCYRFIFKANAGVQIEMLLYNGEATTGWPLISPHRPRDNTLALPNGS
jgi:hypothetical protein